MKRIGLVIGLSTVLWGQAARAEWFTVGKDYEGAVTQIESDTIERDPLEITFVARSVLPSQDRYGAMVYVYNYKLACSLNSIQVLETAALDRDGNQIYYNASRQREDLIMNGTLQARMKKILCGR